MKNLFITALLAVGLSTSAFATDENKISISIRESFKEEFKGIEQVDWTLRDDFVKASFTLKGEAIEAFYDFKGNRLGTSHHVALDELPLNAKRAIAKRYSAYTIIEAVQFNGAEENAYYISVENSDEKLILKIAENGMVNTFKKTRKDKFW
jgi:opacity protein-like surface antigen